jgi:hypothetical protein
MISIFDVKINESNIKIEILDHPRNRNSDSHGRENKVLDCRCFIKL